MENLSVMKCKNCGGVLDIRRAQNGVIECEYCSTVWTVPKQETEPEALKYLHDGNAALDVCKFEDAFVYFQKATELDKKEPEAYFGMALADFKVQYLKDYVNNRLQPICHDVTEKKFTESNAYLRALINATAEQKAEYEKKGTEIDYILEEFRKIKQSGVDYDCFICVKVTGDNGQPTEDSKDANYIYELLQRKGYKPFYSERELRNVTGADYEARILYALCTSECMLLVCRDEGYLQTPWVKNEYTRFLGLVNKEEKESDSIAVVFNGTPIERLPGKRGKLQGIDFALREADGKIVDFVEAHTPEARARREEEERRKASQAEDIGALREEVRKAAQMQRGVGSSVATLLTRGHQELEDGHEKEAQGFFDRVLEIDPESAEAWWGKTLCEIHVLHDATLARPLSDEQYRILSKSSNYMHALKVAKTGDFKKHFDEIHGKFIACAQQQNEGYQKECEQLSTEYSTLIKQYSAQSAEMAREHKVAEEAAERYANEHESDMKEKNSEYTIGCLLGPLGVIIIPIMVIVDLVHDKKIPKYKANLAALEAKRDRLKSQMNMRKQTYSEKESDYRSRIDSLKDKLAIFDKLFEKIKQR